MQKLVLYTFVLSSVFSLSAYSQGMIPGQGGMGGVGGAAGRGGAGRAAVPQTTPNPNIPFGAELLVAGRHAQACRQFQPGGAGGLGGMPGMAGATPGIGGAGAGGAAGAAGPNQPRTVLRGFGAECMPEQTAQNIQRKLSGPAGTPAPGPRVPDNPRLLSAQSTTPGAGGAPAGGAPAAGGARGLYAFGAEKRWADVERRPVQAFPPAPASTVVAAPRPSPGVSLSPRASEQFRNTGANSNQRPNAGPPSDFSNSAHIAFRDPPQISEQTRARLNNLDEAGRRRYEASMRQLAGSNPTRSPTDVEINTILNSMPNRR